MLRDEELPLLPEPVVERGTKLVPYEERFFRTVGLAAKAGYTNDLRVFYTKEQLREYGRAVEQAAYERAAAHVRTLKRDQWYLRVAPEIVVEECAVAIEKLMTQEQPE